MADLLPKDWVHSWSSGAIDHESRFIPPLRWSFTTPSRHRHEGLALHLTGARLTGVWDPLCLHYRHSVLAEAEIRRPQLGQLQLAQGALRWENSVPCLSHFPHPPADKMPKSKLKGSAPCVVGQKISDSRPILSHCRLTSLSALFANCLTDPPSAKKDLERCGRAIASYYSAHKIGLNGGGDGSGSASFGFGCEGRRGFGFPPARE